MKRIALIALPLVVLGIVGAVLLLALRQRRIRASADTPMPAPEPLSGAMGRVSHAEPPAPTAGIEVLTPHEAHREEDEEFKHGAAQHIEEERLGLRGV